MTYLILFRGGRCRIGRRCSRCERDDIAAKTLFAMCAVEVGDLYGASARYVCAAVEGRMRRVGVSAAATARDGVIFCRGK